MDGTVSGTFGQIFSKLDQWSTWGRFALAGLALAFLQLNRWLFGIAFDKTNSNVARQRAVITLVVVWAIVVLVIVVAGG